MVVREHKRKRARIKPGDVHWAQRLLQEKWEDAELKKQIAIELGVTVSHLSKAVRGTLV